MKLLKIRTVVISSLLILIGTINFASAETPAFTIINGSDSLYKYSTEDDVTIYDSFEVQNMDPSRTIVISNQGLINNQKGWFSFLPQSQTLQPNEKKVVNFSINIPVGVCSGSYIGPLKSKLISYSDGDSGSGLSISTAVGKKVTLTVTNSKNSSCIDPKNIPELNVSPAYEGPAGGIGLSVSEPTIVPGPTHPDTTPYTTPYTNSSGEGAAAIDSTTPRVVITNPTQAVNVTVGSGTTNPTIDVGSFISGGTGTIPAITVNSSLANVAIPASTTVTSADPSWDGVIAAQTATTVTIPAVSGENRTFGMAIEIGSTGTKLSFNKGVRILIPGQAGKRAGYIRTGTVFAEITNICGADNQATGDALAVDGDCKIDSGSDLVIWTKHFTSFASFSSNANGGDSGGSIGSVSSGGSGGGGGGSPAKKIPKTVTPGSSQSTTSSSGAPAATPNPKLVVYDICKENYISPFTDIRGHYAEGAINFLYNNYTTDGYKDGTFKTDQNINRAELTKMVLLTFNFNIASQVTSSPFKDVPIKQWYTPYISSAKVLGIISGYKDGNFRPTQNVTRAEALKIILFAAGRSVPQSNGSIFIDITAKDWFYDLVNYGYEKGIIKGVGKNKFVPNSPITRGQAAIILTNSVCSVDTPLLKAMNAAPHRDDKVSSKQEETKF